MVRCTSRTTPGSENSAAPTKTASALLFGESHDSIGAIERDELSAMREGLAVVQQPPRQDGHRVAGARVRHDQLAAPLLAVFREHRRAIAGSVMHDFHFLERQDVRGAQNHRIDAQRLPITARDGRIANRRAHETAHHGVILTLSISRVFPTRTAPASNTSRWKSAGASNVSGSTKIGRASCRERV